MKHSNKNNPSKVPIKLSNKSARMIACFLIRINRINTVHLIRTRLRNEMKTILYYLQRCGPSVRRVATKFTTGSPMEKMVCISSWHISRKYDLITEIVLIH